MKYQRITEPAVVCRARDVLRYIASGRRDPTIDHEIKTLVEEGRIYSPAEGSLQADSRPWVRCCADPETMFLVLEDDDIFFLTEEDLNQQYKPLLSHHHEDVLTATIAAAREKRGLPIGYLGITVKSPDYLLPPVVAPLYSYGQEVSRHLSPPTRHYHFRVEPLPQIVKDAFRYGAILHIDISTLADGATRSVNGYVQHWFDAPNAGFNEHALLIVRDLLQP